MVRKPGLVPNRGLAKDLMGKSTLGEFYLNAACSLNEHLRNLGRQVENDCRIEKGGRQISAFQIRSSWAQFLSFSIFRRVNFSITCVFSMAQNIPTPPASTILF
jgi:hypothetical protein